MDTITTDKLREMIDKKDDFLLIDVLGEKSFKQKHIPGSINVPLERKDFVDAIERIAGTKDRRIIVYCADEECSASPTAARKLEAAGFDQIIDYEGGIGAWAGDSLPLAQGRAI